MAVVSVLVFFVVRLVPGDPAQQVLGQRATPEALQALRHQLGLDQPLTTQLVEYYRHLLTGDLGYSLARPAVPVAYIVFRGLLATAAIVATCIVVSLLVGIPLGMLAARSRSPLIAGLLRGSIIALLAAPPFFVGLLLILVFSLTLRVLPAGGWDYASPLPYIVLPGLALSAYMMPLVMRTVRQAAIDVSGQPFVEAAFARGLSPSQITFRHILPNSLLPVVTLVGLNVGWLISGSVVVEAVFAIPGLGTAMASAVQRLDYPVLQGVAVVAALVVVIANFSADALYRVVDPRARA